MKVVGMVMNCPCTKFYVSYHGGSLVIVIKLKTKWIHHAATKNYLNRVAYFMKMYYYV
jgi:hypothetical protein